MLGKEDTLKRQIEKTAEVSADGVILYAVDDLTRADAAAEIDNAEEAIDVLCLLP